MPAPWLPIRISGQGTVDPTEHRLLVRDVFRLVFFLPHDHFDIAAGVAHALDTYSSAVEEWPTALAEYTCDWWQAFKLEKRGWARIRATLSPSERLYFEDYPEQKARLAEKDGASPYFTLWGERDSGYCFDYRARLPFRDTPRDYVSVLGITWPTEYVEAKGPGVMRELALRIAARLPFTSGHAGPALDIAPEYTDNLGVLRALSLRHPGFDLRHASIHDFMGAQVDGVHWLNFLGQPVLGRLTGARGLRARLHSPTTTVHALDGERVLVTLGPRPEVGDVSLGRTLPAHRELARVLEPWLEPVAPEEAPYSGWRRFLD